PHQHPFLDGAGIVAFHELEAAVEIGLDPGADIFQSGGHHAALFLEALVERLRVLVVEVLDDHEQHWCPPEAGSHQRYAAVPSRNWFNVLHRRSKPWRSRPMSRPYNTRSDLNHFNSSSLVSNPASSDVAMFHSMRASKPRPARLNWLQSLSGSRSEPISY